MTSQAQQKAAVRSTHLDGADDLAAFLAKIARAHGIEPPQLTVLSALSDPLLTPGQAAAESGRGLTNFWRDVKNGLLPRPFYVSRRTPRWRVSELRAAVDACPREPQPPAPKAKRRTPQAAA